MGRFYILGIASIIALGVCNPKVATAFICQDDELMAEVERAVSEESLTEIFRRHRVIADYYRSNAGIDSICAMQAMFKYHDALREAAAQSSKNAMLAARSSILLGQIHYENGANGKIDDGGVNLRIAQTYFQRAHEILEPAINSGHIEALVLSGDLHRDGLGVEESRLMAIDLYHRAAKVAESRSVKLRMLERIESIDQSHPLAAQLREDLYQ